MSNRQSVRELFRPLPVFRIAFWGLVLNSAWEFVQCTFLYDMFGSGFWNSTMMMWSAILGDVVIVFGILLGASLLVGLSHLKPPDAKGLIALLGVGLTAGVALEWVARVLGLWSYTPAMPTLGVANASVGLSPILQMTLLPALCLYLGTKIPWPSRRPQ